MEFSGSELPTAIEFIRTTPRCAAAPPAKGRRAAKPHRYKTYTVTLGRSLFQVALGWCLVNILNVAELAQLIGRSMRPFLSSAGPVRAAARFSNAECRRRELLGLDGLAPRRARAAAVCKRSASDHWQDGFCL
jgi:hypothetical protein